MRGRGGAGFPAGVKWGFLPKGNAKPRVPGDQRRRGRAGHLQGPHDHGARSAPADRGLHHRDARDRRARLLHLRALRAGEVDRAARSRDRRSAPARLHRQDARSASTTRSRSTCTPAPARTSAAKRPRCSTRSRACAASRASSRRSRRSPGAFGCADDRQQRRDASRRCPTSCAWAARTGRRSSRLPQRRRHAPVRRERPREEARASTRRRSGSRCAS